MTAAVSGADSFEVTQGGVSKRVQLSGSWTFGSVTAAALIVSSALTVTGLGQFTNSAVNGVALRVDDAAGAGSSMSFIPNLGAGGSNPLSQAGDTGLFFHDNAVDTGKFVLGGWSASAFGIRFDNVAKTIKFSDSLLISNPASSVNYLKISGETTTNQARVTSEGADANVGINFGTKGAGQFDFRTGGNNYVQLAILHLDSAVNYWTFFGGAAGNSIEMRPAGSDANIGMKISTKGVGTLTFYSASGASTQFRVRGDSATAVNFIDVFGQPTGGGPILRAEGETNVNLNIFSKGTGEIVLGTVQGGAIQVKIIHSASAVNYVQFAGAPAASAPSLAANGSDTNIGLTYSTRGTGAHQFYTGNFSTLQFEIGHTPNAVNRLLVVGGALGDYPHVLPKGTDTNIGIIFDTKGNGGHQFRTGQSGANIQVLVAHIASAVNYVQLSGATTANGPRMGVDGSDTNIALLVSSKGTNPIEFFTNTYSTKQFEVSNTTSAVNWIRATGGTTGNTAKLSAVGSDTNVGLALSSKGTAAVHFYTNDFAQEQVRVDHTASANRQLVLTGSNGGNPTISVSAGALAITPDIWFAGATVVQNTQDTNYTLVASDANKHINHTSATPHTHTIPANASVAYAVGTAVTFRNGNGAGALSIAITTDTMRLAGAGTTGTRTLAANGIATALKVASTEWIISGTGLT